jgi:anti-repressor protein
MSNLQTFDFTGQTVRVLIDQNAKEWFLAKDVCDVLEISNSRDTVSRLDNDQKLVSVVTTSGQKREMTFVSEAGLYELIFTSRKPEARAFKKWVFEEVLPTIRKTGSFQTVKPDALPTHLETARQLVSALEHIEVLQPKAEFYDHVTQSDSELDMHEVAKILDLGLGRNNLMDRMRKDGILMRDNSPYQKFVDAGYFRLVEMKYETLSGEKRIGTKTVATQKGLDFIRRRYGRKTQLQLQLQ